MPTIDSKPQSMTRIGRRLIEDFLLPALDEGKYGELLKWVDREKRHFSIRWSHKNAAKWSLGDTAVFQDWDRLKGHYRPQMKGYYMQAKQRFRAALYKLNSVIRIPCEDKHVKRYQLVLDNGRDDMPVRSKVRVMKKEENQAATVRPTVICKHTSANDLHQEPMYSDDSAAYVKNSESPDHPVSSRTSIKSQLSPDCLKEELDESDDDKSTIKFSKEALERVWNSHSTHGRKILDKYNKLFKKEETDIDSVVKKEFQEDDSPKKLPETPVLQEKSSVPLPDLPSPFDPDFVPVQSFYGPNQNSSESPEILLVRTFNEYAEPKKEDELIVGKYWEFCPVASSSDDSSDMDEESEKENVEEQTKKKLP